MAFAFHKINFLFFYFFILIVSFLISISPLFARMESDTSGYIIWGDVFSSGGLETSTTTNYSLQDTIGEAVILSATSTSSNYGLVAGFRELAPDQFITLTAGSASVDFGTISSSAANTASHTLTVDSNAANGYSIVVSGSTLTSGGDSITAIGATAAASSAGSEQFGINLVANTTPSIGANPSGTAPIGSAAGEYDTANMFAFNSGDTVASASTDVSETVFTVSYLANITSSTEGGTYSTTLTYSAIANF